MMLKFKSGKISLWIVVFAVLATAFAGMATGISGSSVGQFRGTTVILIHNVYELQNMSKNLNASYELANDINATITKTWNGGEGFIPIGSSFIPFNGTFDGHGYKIFGLYINSSANYVGLFGYTTGNVKNLRLVNVNVTTSGYDAEVDGLIGYNLGMVNNCYVTGSVSASGDKSITGGLVGMNDGRVVNSSVRGSVSATGYSVEAGGLVGINEGMVTNSYAIVNVSTRGEHSVAGSLIGWNYVGDVKSSYAIGNVSGHIAGGLFGRNGDGATVENSHYDIDRTLINGGHYITIGGMYNAQFEDWLANGKKLNTANYPSLVPDGEYYDISNVQGLKDMLGFAEDGLKFRLTTNIDLSGMSNFYIPYFEGTFDGNNHTVSNLNLSISFVEYLGFFGINKGTVENVGIVNVSVSGFKAGGLIGWNYGIVERSYTTGYVKGYYVGGLVGENNWDGGVVSNSYSVVNVSAKWKYSVAGGLVGENGGMVSNSYSTGSVNGGQYRGGLIGENNGKVTTSFWDVNTSGIDHSAGGIGLTTAEMMNESTIINAGWDFNTTWGIWNGKTYPFLRWQKMKSIPSAPRNIEFKVSEGYVNLSWEAPSDNGGLAITAYNIYRNGTLIATVPGTQMWYKDSTLKNGVNYTYYVTALNAAGESPKSNEVWAMPIGEHLKLTHVAVILVAVVMLLFLAIVIYLIRKK